MSNPIPSMTIPVDLTNPGQFFACCGLLELADRLWPGAEGWFDGDVFRLVCGHSLRDLLEQVASLSVANTMTPTQLARLEELSRRLAKVNDGADDEFSLLDAMRRKAPICLSGEIHLLINWFCDPNTRGFALKTWAGQQSVLTIAREMHAGLIRLVPQIHDDPWLPIRDIGLPFNFDSDIGGQGTGRDIGFVFDSFKSGRIARFNRGCRPILEFLCFVGLQRFRPLELRGGDAFRYAAWSIALPTTIAAVAASTAIRTPHDRRFTFLMFNRNKDYYCFYPATPYQGDGDDRSE